MKYDVCLSLCCLVSQQSSNVSSFDVRCTGYRSFVDSYFGPTHLFDTRFYGLECIGVRSCERTTIDFVSAHNFAQADVQMYVVFFALHTNQALLIKCTVAQTVNTNTH